jgi:hypothetical protein
MGRLLEVDHVLFRRQFVENDQQQEEADHDLCPPPEYFPAEENHMGYPPEVDHALFRR